jgi:hypothetical protein
MSDGSASYIITVEEQAKRGNNGYGYCVNENTAGALSTQTKIKTIV